LDTPVVPDEGNPSFEATISSPTRITLSQEVKCNWVAGDCISVFGSQGTNYWFETSESGATAVFVPGVDEAVESGLASSSPYALYPYRYDNSISGSVLTSWIAPVQAPVADNFPSDQKPLLVAQASAAGKLSFAHASSIVKIRTESEGVTAIVLKGENGEHLNGTYSYDVSTSTGSADGNEYLYLQNADQSAIAPGTYYMIVPPTVFEKGFTVQLLPEKEGLVNYKYTGKSVTLEAGHILNLGTVNYKGEDTEKPAVSFSGSTQATVGQAYNLQLDITDDSGMDTSADWFKFDLTDTGWNRPTISYDASGSSNITGTWFGEFSSAGIEYGAESATLSLNVTFAKAGTYYLNIFDLADTKGNSWPLRSAVTDWNALVTSSNCGIVITVSESTSGGSSEMVSETRTGLADGYYDISFNATRSLDGDIVYAQASSGSNPVRMTPLRYGSSVSHVIRGVQVIGGSCTFSTAADGSSPASFSISDIQYTLSSEWTWLQGGDFSRLNMELEHGVTYRDGGSAKDPVDIAVENGWNIVRLRVFNDPGNTAYTPSAYMTAGYVCLSDMLKLAKKARKAGLQILLTLHYSDYWTDPLIQNVPHEWSGKTEAELQAAVYDFTYEVLLEMISQSTEPAYVAIGNETNTGMLYGGGTNGKGYNSDYRYNPSKFTGFFNKGAQAVRELTPDAKVVLHLANPHSNLTSLITSLNDSKLDYDVLGISYYPYWSDITAAQFVTRADSFAASAGRKVIVMETGFNWNTVTYYGDAGQLKDQGPYESVYPASEVNQRNFLQELLVELKKSQSVVGVFYWDPLTVRLNSWSGMDHDENGTSCPNHDNGTVTQNSALFDFDGNALQAWKAFKYNN